MKIFRLNAGQEKTETLFDDYLHTKALCMIQAPPRTIMEIFEGLPEGTLCELINNRIVMPPSPSYEHQDVSKKIVRQLDAYVIANNLGDIQFAPLDVYLGRENVFQPDILFIATDRLSIVQRGKIRGAPDLVIEILSPGTEDFDYTEKRTVYEQFGVKEYWIVDPNTKRVNGFRLQQGGFLELPETVGMLTSPLLNTTIHF